MATIDLPAITTNAAAVFAGIAGMIGTSTTPVEQLPQTPWTVIGLPKGTLSAGTFEMHEFTLPARVYLCRVADWPRQQALAMPFINAAIAAFRTNVSLSGACTQCLIGTWDMSLFETIGSTDYQVIDFGLNLLVLGAATYTV